MTITKINNRWYDENNNSWITEQLATLYSPTLINCRWCKDCYDCSKCRRCSNCSNCSGCDSCRGCSNCSECDDCTDWTDNKKYEPVVRPFIDCTNRLLEPDL